MKLADAYPVRVLCRLLDVPRSSLYYQACPSVDEAVLKTALLELAAEWPTYGYRRLTRMMQRLDWPVNAKRVRRWMAELGIAGTPPKRGRRTTDSNHAFPRYPNLVETLEISRPDQVWVADITYIRLGSEFIYLAILMDVFTRAHSRLAPGPKSRPRAHVGCVGTSPGRGHSRDSSLRPRRAIRRHSLRRSAATYGCHFEHGRSR